MKLLAIETSSSACSVALLLENEVKVLHEDAPMKQAQMILPMIDKLLKSSNIKLNQLDALAFGCGPGSFTGVRIAVSVMQGFGYAAQLRLIPVSSLAALAQATYADLGWKKILAAVDARIQEVYWGAYAVNSKGLVELIGKELVCPPEQISIPEGSDWYGAGSAWEVYKLPFNPLQVDTKRLPTATGVVALAVDKYEKGQWVMAEAALPTYLRDQVAKKNVK